MTRISNIFAISLVAVVALATSACPDRVSIADIESDPGRYSQKDVAVAGTVVDSYGLSIPGTQVRGGIYKIADGTGSIWVLTDRTVPIKGAKLGVKGKVGTGVNWNGKNYGLGIMESDRRFAKR